MENKYCNAAFFSVYVVIFDQCINENLCDENHSIKMNLLIWGATVPFCLIKSIYSTIYYNLKPKKYSSYIFVEYDGGDVGMPECTSLKV